MAVLLAALLTTPACSSSAPSAARHPELWCDDLRNIDFSRLAYIPGNLTAAERNLAAFSNLRQHAPTDLAKSLQNIYSIYLEYQTYFLGSTRKITRPDGSKAVIDKQQIDFDNDDLRGANKFVIGWFDDVAAYGVGTCSTSTFDEWRRQAN